MQGLVFVMTWERQMYGPNSGNRSWRSTSLFWFELIWHRVLLWTELVVFSSLRSPVRSAASIGHSCCVAQQRHQHPVPVSPHLVASQKSSAWMAHCLQIQTGGIWMYLVVPLNQNKNRTNPPMIPDDPWWSHRRSPAAAASVPPPAAAADVWTPPAPPSASPPRDPAQLVQLGGSHGIMAEIHATSATSHFSHLRWLQKWTQKPHQLSQSWGCSLSWWISMRRFNGFPIPIASIICFACLCSSNSFKIHWKNGYMRVKSSLCSVVNPPKANFRTWKSEETWSLMKCWTLAIHLSYLANFSPTAAPSPPGFVDAPVAAMNTMSKSILGWGAANTCCGFWASIHSISILGYAMGVSESKLDCILLTSTQNLLTCGMRFPTAQSTLATSGSSCLQLLLLIFQQPASVITWHWCLQKLAPSFLVVPQKDIVVGGFGEIPCFDIPVSKDHWIMDVQMCMNVCMYVYIQIRINMDRYFSIMYQFSRIIHFIYIMDAVQI